jgi:membrane-bound lytic murein transglycosylase A
MSKRRNIFIFLAVLLVIFVAVYSIILFIREKPIEWTTDNSLQSVVTPDLKDSKDIPSIIKAIDLSLSYFKKKDPQQPIPFGMDRYTIAHIMSSLEDFKLNLQKYGFTDIFFQYIKENYRFYRSSAKEVLITGYYEAQLRGSLKQSEGYNFPLYKKPEDLIVIDLSKFPIYQDHKGLPKVLKGRFLEKKKRIHPYYSRQEIDSMQVLSGRDLEIIWVDDPIDVFFLQIQGSGIVQLDSGEIKRVNYAESNGHPYRAIGRLLIDRQLLTRENMSMQSIRKYLQDHPEEMEEIFNYNPSYIFFREVKVGPLGCLGVPVTPYRSIATDSSLFPQGALGYLRTEVPEFDDQGQVKVWKPFEGFVLNQDTGGAIRTPGRVDFFTGHGQQSELVAGHMKQQGMFYFLVKKEPLASN